MRKTLILLSLIAICWGLLSSYQSNNIPVFLMTEEAEVLTKGYYGSVLIMELTFEYPYLNTLIENPLTEHTLFLLDMDFINRADQVIKQLQEHNRQVGLLVATPTQFEEALQSYIDVFKERPLWVMLQDKDYIEEFRNTAFSHQLNVLAPSITLQQPFPTEIKKGSFIDLQLDGQQNVALEPLLTWMNSQSFVSIEESLFGYTINSQKTP